ncbi:hypothetical protein BJV74DRAFT_847267 [Russula compacta]|nr:hypothetical protein BJV74DRAFT_847267 [Russula compacta]
MCGATPQRRKRKGRLSLLLIFEECIPLMAYPKGILITLQQLLKVVPAVVVGDLAGVPSSSRLGIKRLPFTASGSGSPFLLLHALPTSESPARLYILDLQVGVHGVSFVAAGLPPPIRRPRLGSSPRLFSARLLLFRPVVHPSWPGQYQIELTPFLNY